MRRENRTILDTTSIRLGSLSQAEKKVILEELKGRDKKLKGIIEGVGDFKFSVEETESPFESIAESIVYQQLTGKAAATIFSRLKGLFGSDRCPSPDEILSAPDTVLRSAGLSRSKVAALKDLSHKSINGQIPTLSQVELMSDEEIITSLTAVKGVGTWTAQMFLIFRLGRADVMPSGDFGVRKGFSIVYLDGVDLPSPSSLEKHAERWRPYRTVGSWFMWRAVDLHRQSLLESDLKSKSVKPAASKPTNSSGRKAKAKVI